MKQLLIFVLIFADVSASLAQGAYARQYTVEEGLTSNHVYTTFQDRRGYIWVATTNGVSCFDGICFTNFTSNNGLPDNDIAEINEDLQGRIWLGCYSGEPCYIKNNKVYTSKQDTALRLIQKKGYFRFFQFNGKLILCSSSTRCYEVDSQGNLKKIPLRALFTIVLGNSLLGTTPVKNEKGYCYYLLDSLYRKTDSLCFEYDWSQTQSFPRRVKEYKALQQTGPDCFSATPEENVRFMCQVQNHKIIRRKTASLSPVFQTMYTHGNNLWGNHFGVGLIPLTPDVREDPSGIVLFEGLPIQNFMVDREGNYWGATAGEGLYMMPNNHFLYYNESNGLAEDNIDRLAIIGDEVYLGFGNSIQKHNEGKFHSWPLHQPVSEKNRVIGLFADGENIIAATPNDIHIIDKNKGKLRRLYVGNIKCLAKGPAGTILYGNHSSVFQFSLNKNRVEDTIFSGRTTAIHALNENEILVGTMSDLLRYKKKNGRWQKQNRADTTSLFENLRVSCIGNLDSIIVAGTVQKGLLLICGKDHEFVNLGKHQDNLNCRNLFIEADRTIWLASFSGLFKVRLGNTIHSYTVEHIAKFNGLLSDNVNDVVVSDKQVFVAGSKGLSVFQKDAFAHSPQTPPAIYIRDLRINGRSYGEPGTELRLPADSNTLEFQFSAIDFKSLGQILFKYRLHGITDGWVQSANNFVRFESLPPGHYRFEVMAMNSQEQWSEVAAFQELTIRPPWWLNTWFMALCILFTLGLVFYAVYRILLHKHQKQIRETILKRHITELELRAIKAQINPHFMFNTLNAIQYFISNNQNEQADNYLERMASLLRKTLEFSTKTTITVEDEVAYLRNYLELEKLRFDKQVDFRISNHIPHMASTTELPPMILQPHVENALRHGLKNRHGQLKKLDISFRLINGDLVCEVADNGIGRKASSEKKAMKKIKQVSMGMELSHAKLLIHEQLTGKKINTEIIDQYVAGTQTAAGTLIRITINQSPHD